MNRSPNVGKMIREGRGQGEGDNYKPWITNHDFHSRGRVVRVQSKTTLRIMRLLSQLEADVAITYNIATNVLDVREQFPLFETDETVAIAEECGIQHPCYPNGQPVVLTTDFLITLKDSDGKTTQVARTVKYVRDLTRRTLEKFEIERGYWAKRRVDWGIITENDLPAILTKNTRVLYPCRHLSLIEVEARLFQQARSWLTDNYVEATRPLNAVVSECDAVFAQKPGTSLKIAWHLIATRQWACDWTAPMEPYAAFNVAINF